MSSGTSPFTFPNTWLSVTTSFGFFPRTASVVESSSSFTVTATAPASRIPRIVCCWGRIRRPLGAALSTGITRTTKSDGESRSPMRGT